MNDFANDNERKSSSFWTKKPSLTLNMDLVSQPPSFAIPTPMSTCRLFLPSPLGFPQTPIKYEMGNEDMYRSPFSPIITSPLNPLLPGIKTPGSFNLP